MQRMVWQTAIYFFYKIKPRGAFLRGFRSSGVSDLFFVFLGLPLEYLCHLILKIGYILGIG